MANFDRLFHWHRFVPDIGNNRELLADPFTLELAVGLTKLELRRFLEGSDKMLDVKAGEGPDAETAALDQSAEVLAAEWSPFVRLGPGTHSFAGKPVASLRDYLRFALEQPGLFNVSELIRETIRLNSVKGTRALFSEPPAGSSSTTRSQTGGA